jgi:hypothetical protein
MPSVPAGTKQNAVPSRFSNKDVPINRGGGTHIPFSARSNLTLSLSLTLRGM